MKKVIPAYPITPDGEILGFDCPFCRDVVVADIDDSVCKSGHHYFIRYDRRAAYAVCEANNETAN